ncbi:hypothetical protein L226DRAFT_564984 [Lentinus tigrinus ALCF2SS1-7]|uniref:uncharacterized protein n=1 Tax=Lentinus tigrinus ALCF2SS1-7 TaxID=1328758 RepID=UPI0011663738|nr:hypothetical protein L226DRAFT_564984 [Lentinus tigrinus ALCF2SS1-7]
MPPPPSVPLRPPAEPAAPEADPLTSFRQEFAPPRHAFHSPSIHSEPSSVPAPPAVHAAPTRMPPMIGSSQYTVQHPNRIAPPVHIQPKPMNATVMPVSVPSAHVPASIAHGAFNGFHPVPDHLSGMNGNLDDLPFAIDNTQIDPQLIADALGLSSIGSHGAPTDAEQSNPDHASVADLSLPRPSSDRFPDVSTAAAHPPEDQSPDRDSGSGNSPAKRKRSKKGGPAANDNAPEPTTKRRRTGPRSRTRPPSPPPFDPDADPGEDIDPTVVTMAALCDDMGKGRVSSKAAQIVSNHAAWRAANREKRARMKAVMEAKKYGRNPEDDEETSTPVKSAPQEVDPAASTSRAGTPAGDSSLPQEENEVLADKDADDFDYSENLAVSQYNVQVRIGANGETIIDEDSLFVNRDEEHRTEDYIHVEESDFTKFVNSATYSKKVRGSRWSAEETELFYNALSQFGENYELISYVLPGRDRKACKNKFKSEDRKNPARITYCLNNRTPYDIATLSRMTGKDFSGPTPEIRAPTPVRSAELHGDDPPQSAPSPDSPRVVRKKSKTQKLRDAGLEVIGSVDDFDKEDSEEPVTVAPSGLDILSR